MYSDVLRYRDEKIMRANRGSVISTPSSIFVTCVMIMIIFNVIYVSAHPDLGNNMTVGAVTGLVGTALATGILAGIQVLGTGLNDESIKIMFGMGAIVNILFQINIGELPLGLGLANNMINAFSPSEAGGLGYFIAGGLAIVTLICGLLTIVGD